MLYVESTINEGGNAEIDFPIITKQPYLVLSCCFLVNPGCFQCMSTGNCCVSWVSFPILQGQKGKLTCIIAHRVEVVAADFLTRSIHHRGFSSSMCKEGCHCVPRTQLKQTATGCLVWSDRFKTGWYCAVQGYACTTSGAARKVWVTGWLGGKGLEGLAGWKCGTSFPASPSAVLCPS